MVDDQQMPRKGIDTANNALFVRLWWEVSGDDSDVSTAPRREQSQR